MNHIFLIFGYGVPKNILKDDNYNVYKTEDIITNKVNPSIIAKYTKNNGEYNLETF